MWKGKDVVTFHAFLSVSISLNRCQTVISGIPVCFFWPETFAIAQLFICTFHANPRSPSNYKNIANGRVHIWINWKVGRFRLKINTAISSSWTFHFQDCHLANYLLQMWRNLHNFMCWYTISLAKNWWNLQPILQKWMNKWNKSLVATQQSFRLLRHFEFLNGISSCDRVWPTMATFWTTPWPRVFSIDKTWKPLVKTWGFDESLSLATRTNRLDRRRHSAA